MSEDRTNDAQQTGGRIADLPASDQQLNAEDRSGGARGGGGGQPSPDATQPSPEATQPSPGNIDAQRTPAAPEPQDRSAAAPNPGVPEN
ncbi:MAG TPA: hypothetical protein VGW12_01785 [Pyrinomonadaceae bacterium]|nr:hypothetical protein [Pyrinomonadaceae bacterium]